MQRCACLDRDLQAALQQQAVLACAHWQSISARHALTTDDDLALQAQEAAELAQLREARRRALEQRDAQMRQLDELKGRILAERSAHMCCLATVDMHCRVLYLID